MNIVLVVFDSLRKDCVGLYGTPPWGPVHTPHLDALAAEALVLDRAFPESLPTLPTRRALYTGRRVYPFVNGDFRLKGDFVGAPGWGPIPEDQPTLAEMLREAGYRTGLIADVYHMFKPSRRTTGAASTSGPSCAARRPTPPAAARRSPGGDRPLAAQGAPDARQGPTSSASACRTCTTARREEDYFNARVFTEAVRWLEQNLDADRFFLTVESFDPHEPWFVPEHYRRLYDDSDGPQQVVSGYADTSDLDPASARAAPRRTTAAW